MAEPKLDFFSWVGLIILCLVMLAFIALTSCRKDFFLNFAPMF